MATTSVIYEVTVPIGKAAWARCIAPSTAPCLVLEQALAFTGGTQDGPRFRLFWLLLAPHFFLGGRNLLSIEATIT